MSSDASDARDGRDACDVVVVGAGPVGLTLSILLSQRGHAVTILERQPAPYPLPRAVHFDHEVGRIFQSAGIGDELAELSEPAHVYEWRNGDGLPLLRVGRVGAGPSGWPLSSMFHQPTLEGGTRAASTLTRRRHPPRLHRHRLQPARRGRRHRQRDRRDRRSLPGRL